MMHNKQVIYFGVDGVSGYANAAKGYMYDLLQQNSLVYFVPVTGIKNNDKTNFGKYFDKNLKKLPMFDRNEKLKGADIVFHVAPEFWQIITNEYIELIGNSKVIGRTVWDFDKLPDVWVNNINNSIVTVVSVPSEWNRSVFINSGVTKEIIVEPHTVPNIDYKLLPFVDLLDNCRVYSPTHIDYDCINKRTKYLCVTSLVTRKNIEFLLDSYLDSFNYDDETILLLKITCNAKQILEFDTIIQTIITNKVKHKSKSYSHAPIAVIATAMNFDSIQSLYDHCDVYVNVSQGEGFGIPCYNATLKNKKIISAIHGGMADYLSKYLNVYVLDYKINAVDNYSITKNKNSPLWIDVTTKGIAVTYDSLCNAFKTTHMESATETVYFEPVSVAHTNDVESNSIFPIYFKNGWYRQSDDSSVWSKECAEVVVGDRIYKLEFVIECLNATTLWVSVNDKNYMFSANRGQHCLKILQRGVKNIVIKSHGFSGALINRDPNMTFGIKVNGIYVNGSKLITSRVQLSSINFDEQILNLDAVKNVSTYVRRDLDGGAIQNFHSINDDNKYSKKINLGRQFSQTYHRSGWNYILNSLVALNSSNGVHCDGYIEQTFGKRKYDELSINTIPYDKNWIGFLHNPPNIPAWFDDNNVVCNTIFNDPVFIKSLDTCKGIFTFSEYHAKYVRELLPDVTVETLYHPTELPDIQFDFEAFKKNYNKKLISVGWWLRKPNAMYTLNVPAYSKIRILPNDACLKTVTHLEKVDALVSNQKITDKQRESVHTMINIPNEQYDALLSKNLVYLDLYDASANNTLLECMARCTPVFVNRLPAVVEYLGESYPLYIDSQFDLVEKIKNYDLIRSAHLYLKSTRFKVDVGNFILDLTRSNIYKRL